ncbi:uncharacterized protein LOC127129873 [Lathyrus oleraceus]|uniref:uncharacterized protein LOC127129873 n=1 Tax=Pisum sativum TaxID=3888 RepID=UPI0021CEF691|nr:uncharacterized protein LOC127129873 [Pisum sativum]
MAQLADKVRHIERLKAEKTKIGRYHKKEKVSYIAVDEYSYDDEEFVDKSEVNMGELKHGPPYTCKVLKPSNEKSPIEAEKIDKYVARTYMFDVSKCDEIFDLLVKDGQIIIPRGLKEPPFRTEKEKGILDLVQKALKEGKLQFGERPKMQVDSDPMKVEEALYYEPFECMMVESTDGPMEPLAAESLDESFECMIVETTDGFDKRTEDELEVVYP